MSEFRAYIQHGWRICSIDKGKKAPVYPAWNTEPIPEDAADGLDGAGLLHALSGTCALDIDQLDLARPWLAERGVDVDALLDDDRATQIVSGRPGRAKLLYRMKRPLRTFKPTGSGLELRCANLEGRSVQDVLPPTIHPDTKRPYEWGGGVLSDWRELTAIPSGLLSVWRELAAGDSDSPVMPTERPRATIDLSKLKKAAFRHSPDCEYDEWIKVGMQLHDGTGGAQEGFDIWCEWSRGIKRSKYPGDTSLKSHWMSFNSDGKHAAKGEALVNELPADADEFDVVEAPKDETETTEAKEELTKKQIREKAADILLKRLVYVTKANKYFDMEQHEIITGGNDALQHRFTHLMPGSAKGSKLDPVKVLKVRGAQQVHSVGFHPGEGVLFDNKGRRFANMFRAEALPKPLEPTALEREKIEWLFDRIDDPVFREYLMQFFGHIVQRPGIKVMSAPLIWSDTTGNGKSTLLEEIPRLIVGDEYYQGVESRQLEDNFNGFLVGKWCIALKEFRANSRGDRTVITERLKNWITASTVPVRSMFLDAYEMPNHFFLTASSNHPDAAQLDDNDRRWAVHEMHADAMTPTQVKWIYHDFLLTERAAGVLRHYFLGVSLEGFNASAKAPETAARSQMVAASKSADEEALVMAFDEHSEPMAKDIVLASDVTNFVRRHTPARNVSAERIGRLLARPPFNGERKQLRDGQARFWAVVIRNHAQWRNAASVEMLAHIRDEDIDLRS